MKQLTLKFEVSKHAAGRLVMTETAYFASLSKNDCLKDLGVDRYEIVATLDNRTSDTCQALDGEVFKTSEYEVGITASPFHPYCRTTTCPYFDDEFTADELRVARDEDGQYYTVPSNMKYPEWKEAFVDGGSKEELDAIGTTATIEKNIEGIINNLENETVEWSEKVEDTVENSVKSGTIVVHKSLGAAAKNYQVKLLDGKQHTKLAENQKIEGKAFAGKGTETEIRDRFRLENDYHIPADEWAKVSGKGYVIVNGKRKLAELHWYEAEGDIYEIKVKRYLDES